MTIVQNNERRTFRFPLSLSLFLSNLQIARDFTRDSRFIAAYLSLN